MLRTIAIFYFMTVIIVTKQRTIPLSRNTSISSYEGYQDDDISAGDSSIDSSETIIGSIPDDTDFIIEYDVGPVAVADNRTIVDYPLEAELTISGPVRVFDPIGAPWNFLGNLMDSVLRFFS